MTSTFMIRCLMPNGPTCLTMLFVTRTTVQISVEIRRIRRPCVFFLDLYQPIHPGRLLAARINAATVPKWVSRTIWLCSFSRPRAEGTMVTVTQQFVVIKLIEHDAGFRSQKFHRAGSPTLGEYGKKIPTPMMQRHPHRREQVCLERKS